MPQEAEARAPRFLVIGASGLIGERFLRALGPDLALGTYFSRPFAGGTRFDVVTDSLDSLLKELGGRFTHALVMGGNAAIDQCARDPEGTARLNVVALSGLVDDLLERSITPIFTSSDAVYDGSHGAWNEDEPVQPVLVYGRQKLAVERHLETCARPWLVVRLAKVLDAEGHASALLRPWITALCKGELIRCATDQRFSPVGVEDAVHAIHALARTGARGLFNLGGGETLSRWDLLAKLAAAVGRVRKIEPRIETCSIRDFPFVEPRPLDTSMNIGKLVAAIDYRPELLELDLLARGSIARVSPSLVSAERPPYHAPPQRDGGGNDVALRLSTRGKLMTSRLPASLRLKLFQEMAKVRRVEERIKALYPQGDMRCPTHFSIGQEAVSAGVCAALLPADYVISAHRSHAHYLNKGGDLRSMFAELYGKSGGCAQGRGGSMHLIDLSVNFLGCVPLVGSTMPIGVGASFGARLQGIDAVTVVFFGDGATETGVFHESLNFAATHKLRVLFVCENNLYSVNTPLAERQPSGRTICDLARGHGIPAEQADGQLVETVYGAALPMLERVRRGEGPGFLEFMTYRWLEHCGPAEDLHLGFRPLGEFEHWSARCPVRLQREALRADGVLDDAGEAAFNAKTDAAIDDAVAFAEASPFPGRDELALHLYAVEVQ